MYVNDCKKYTYIYQTHGFRDNVKLIKKTNNYIYTNMHMYMHIHMFVYTITTLN